MSIVITKEDLLKDNEISRLTYLLLNDSYENLINNNYDNISIYYVWSNFTKNLGLIEEVRRQTSQIIFYILNPLYSFEIDNIWGNRLSDFGR